MKEDTRPVLKDVSEAWTGLYSAKIGIQANRFQDVSKDKFYVQAAFAKTAMYLLSSVTVLLEVLYIS